MSGNSTRKYRRFVPIPRLRDTRFAFPALVRRNYSVHPPILRPPANLLASCPPVKLIRGFHAASPTLVLPTPPGFCASAIRHPSHRRRCDQGAAGLDPLG